MELEVFLEVSVAQVALGKVLDYLCRDSSQIGIETYFIIDVDHYIVSASGHDALRGTVSSGI